MDRKIKTITDYCELLNECHNIVLTAPGTGKTYLARQIAAQMVLGKKVDDLETLEDDEKDILKERTAFVQFHPSYDYTDFVEGLRPDSKTDGGNEIVFERRDGIFKEFCKKVIVRSYQTEVKSDDVVHHESDDVELLKIVFTELLEDIKKKRKDSIEQRKNESVRLIGVSARNNIEMQKDGKPFVMSLETVLELYNKAPNVKNVRYSREKEGDGYVKVGGDAPAKWAVMNYLVNKMEEKRIVNQVGITNTSSKYVFIIDEINRGELSKIFGELFFSIDPGYRGEKGRVNTQYQNLITDGPFKDSFFVPKNVYVIGTMNDIDRSIESMDFAIRRRFAWVEVKANDNTEMLSNLKTVERSKAEKVMFALNDAIWNEDNHKGIEGLSRAYHIGASYFLKLDNFIDSDNPFKDLWDFHLEGLLREYLRGLDDAEEKLITLQRAYNEAAGING